MRGLIEGTANRLGKHADFALDPALTGADLLEMSGHLLGWTLRGAFYRARMGSASGLVMVGRNVALRYPRHFHAGKNLVIEDYAEIMALSKRGIICGNNVTIGARSIIKPSSYYGLNIGEGLLIGDNSNIGSYSYVGCSGYITIGRNVMISPRVSLYAENHNFQDTGRSMRDQGVTRESIVIEDDCWIASGSIILAGVTVGHGSIVAAGSVVTHDVPPFGIVGGSPARLIRSRLDERSRSTHYSPEI